MHLDSFLQHWSLNHPVEWEHDVEFDSGLVELISNIRKKKHQHQNLMETRDHKERY